MTAPIQPEWTGDDFWSGTRRPVESSTGLPPAAYTDADFFAAEQERVFEQAWVCAGIADEVAAPGRILVRQVGRRSVLITRDGDGLLHAFINSCRHRGTELVEADCDIAATIRCPYHRWGYALDGRLKATPFFEDLPRTEFDRADFGLAPVRVAAWGVLLFVCLSDRTPPLDVWLGDLPERMGGYGFEAWTTQHEQSLDIAANWKLISENFQEYYHLTWVHPELAKVSRVADHYRYQGHGMYCGQTTTPVSGDERNDWLALPEASGLDGSDAVSGRFVAIFPNVILSVLPNHVWMMRLEPMSAGVTREVCTMLLPPSDLTAGPADQIAEAIEPTRDFWLDVNAEDIDIVQRGQRGLTHGGLPPGPLAPRFEEPLHRFHNMLADHMSATVASDCPVAVRIPDGDRPSVEDDRRGAGINPSPPTIDVHRMTSRSVQGAGDLVDQGADRSGP